MRNCIKQLGATCFVTSILMFSLSSSLLSQETDEPQNFGRQARKGTPITNRDPGQPLTKSEKIHHLLSRVTFGVTPELMKEVESQGIKNWLENQLEDEVVESSQLMDRLAKLKSLPISTQAIVQNYNKQGEERNLRNVPAAELKDAVFLLAVYGNHQLKEVVCDFWRNHFSVDSSKGNVRFYATTFERDVIRAEALGTFERMLNKQARHPAMLIYLDNYISRATPTKTLNEIGRKALMTTRDYGAALNAVDIAKMRGINENFARELMELHTLGVDNYYTQDDVISVANALTGWTLQQNPAEPIEFKFRSNMHASENRVFLKKKIHSQPANSELEGQAILNVLARHKGTAKFIAYKLCRHLVNDAPNENMVRRVASPIMRGNELSKVYAAIFKDREFYAPENYQVKFKRPFEFVVSALRTTHAEISSTRQLHRTLVSLGEPIYQCEDPTGYYDQADAWRDPGVMANRWHFALQLGLGKIKGVQIPDSFWDVLETDNPKQWKEVLTAKILPGGCTPKTSHAIDKLIEQKMAESALTQKQMGGYIIGLLLGSPEFQRQ